MKITPDLGRPALERAPGPAKEMLSVRDEAGKLHFRINYSSLSIILTCMRKSELALLRGIKARAESPATLFGTAIHKALEVFYREPPENRQIPANFASNADLMIAGQFENDHFLYRAIAAFLKAAEPLRVLPESDKRSLSAGVWTLGHYFKTYIADPFVICSDDKGPMTERFCEIVLHDSPTLKITYFGTLDVILKNTQTNLILPGDHKTFSSNPSDFYKRVKPNHQYTGYVMLANEALGLSCDTFLVNGLQVKPRPVTARGGPPNFPRQPTRRTAEDIAEFKQAVVWACEQYAAAMKSGFWAMGDVNACAMYNGCQFQKVCEVPKSIRESVLSADFLEGVQSAEAE